MKIYLLIIAIVVLSGCSKVKKIESTYENGTIKESYSVQKDDPTLKHGIYQKFDENEKLIEVSNYENGKINNERQLFYPSGQLMVSEHYTNNVFNGTYTAYYESGNKMEEGVFEDNLMIGVWNYYYDLPEDIIKEEIRYIDNIENGAFKEYHKNGELKSEGTYKDEYEDGPYKEFDNQGRLIKEINYTMGRPNHYIEYDSLGVIVKDNKY